MDATTAHSGGERDLAGVLASMAATVGSSRALPADRDSLVAVVAAAQALVNAAAAVQDDAIAHLAAVEPEWAEDGTLAEVTHPLGHVAIDAADLIAPVLGASHDQAQRRVAQAVTLTGQRPRDDGRGPVEESGLRGLHTAMRAGRLDTYRAGVLAGELDLAPADVAATVTAALDPHLGAEAAPALRRRVRRLLARISPDLLRQRAERARTQSGLRRWVSEPGVDTWYGTFPSEDAATAWAAIDDHARHLLTDGTCTNLDQARAKALTDLVLAQTTVSISLVLTTPADTTTPATHATEQAVTGQAPAPATTTAAANGTNAPADAANVGEPAPLATPHLDADPSCGRAEADHGGDVTGLGELADRVNGGPVGAGEDLLEVRGIRPGEAALVSRAWLAQLLAADPASTGGRDTRRTRPRTTPPNPPGPPGPSRAAGHDASSKPLVTVSTAPCHPITGALQPDPHRPPATTYRPPDWLVTLVKARDGRCRFPGCSVAARFCDLDHVSPWPLGPTTADNLTCLCRRHHRIKQRPGWRARPLPGAVLEWTDPTGRVTTSHPQDALHGTVLPATTHPRSTMDAPTTATATADLFTATPTGSAADARRARLTVKAEHALAGISPHTWRRTVSAHGHHVTVLHTRRRPRPQPVPVRHWPETPPF